MFMAIYSVYAAKIRIKYEFLYKSVNNLIQVPIIVT